MVERERAGSYTEPGRVEAMVHMGCLCNAKEFQVAIWLSTDRFCTGETACERVLGLSERAELA